MRVAALTTTVLATLVATSSTAGPTTAPTTASSRNAERALASYDAMQRSFFDPRSGGYRETVGSAARAHAWPLSQALAATIAVRRALRPSPIDARAVEDKLQALEQLRAGPVYSAAPGIDVYWDDNEWIALDFLAVGDARGRTRALSLFTSVVRAWDDDPSKPCAGGVQWTTATRNDDRNTVSTANGALVGLRLYALTKDPSVLYWSRKMLDWVDGCMLAEDGLYWDHIDRDGTVDTTHWSYNQGIVIGALVLLAQETGDATALPRAEQLADSAIAYFAGRWLNAEPPEFSAIFFHNLLRLAAVDKRADYVAAAQAFADGAWVTHRNAKTGLFAFRGPARLLDQAALVQVYSDLASFGVA